MSQGIEPLTVLVDTREQTPWLFSPGVTPLRATLPSGDYSLPGLESRVALERKSLADLVGSLTSGRDRFMREMERLARFDFAAIVVEGDLENVLRKEYRSEASPSSIMGSCAMIHARYGVPTIWCSTRACAILYAEKLLTQAWNDHLVKAAHAAND